MLYAFALALTLLIHSILLLLTNAYTDANASANANTHAYARAIAAAESLVHRLATVLLFFLEGNNLVFHPAEYRRVCRSSPAHGPRTLHCI